MRRLMVFLALLALDASTAHAQAARVRLQSTADGEVEMVRRPVFLLAEAQTELFEGRYADAASAFGAVLASGALEPYDTLAAWAYHGIALAHALAGERAAARASYDSLLTLSPESPLAIADSIEALVLTGQRERADTLIDSFLANRGGVLPKQYAHSFRALSFLLASRCADALNEVARVPDPGRPLPQAIRGVCAAKSGHHAEALALRDSVLQEPLADPFSWPMVIARGVARKIH
jgi:uncharacterized membrane-anchored protein